ncbi:hypothetical protein OG369_43425 [Streptomyces sp. NBC_01221]|uniref:hypothetical protein n=1 Tax=Streptomyces sp. NBC_01221 TaxID=2903782 RepID=UPI002256FDC3|nr:hypothetical protein [Streptomyces sp. NBC_01221]MCX4792630.1 hypothetical protein [Streptomyces sp. NBC_01221]
MNRNPNTARTQGEKTPVSQLVPAIPAVMVVLVLGVFTVLILTGMPLETAAITVGVGGTLGIELVRRLMNLFPARR